METEVKKRAWVKDAAIVFLAILLVLTFFSQTIMNRSLVEVATQQVKEGPITAKVRGKGIVVANGSNNVKATGSVTINKVMVRTGEKVKEGDVLFILGAGAGDELEAAKEALFELQSSYDLALASIPTGSNYTPQQNEIAKIAKNVAEAKAAMNEIADALKITGEEDAEGMALSKKEIERLKAERDKTIAELEKPRAKRDELQGKINSAKIEWDMAEETVKGLYALYEAEEDEAKKEELFDRWQKAVEDCNAKKEAYDAVCASVKSELDLAVVEVTSLEIKLNELTEKLKSLEAFFNSDVVGVSSKYTYEDYFAAKRNYEDLVLDYQSAMSNLEHQYNNDSRTQYSAALSAQAIAVKIERQKEKIKELSGEGEENVITAKTAGTVTEINCAPGDSVLKDDILAVIEVPDMGYTISFSVTNDQARRLKIGDTGTISNFYWGNSITATLKSIATDKKNPQTQKTLTFDLEGDVTAGSELSVSVGQKSANYDLVVPNSSIKNDNNGSFVYVISAKNSPLGNRYIAKRVKVEVLASDDTNSAVNAELSSGDFVITTTAAPIKNGDQVRLADSAN